MTDLTALRREIDELDQKILALLARRFQCSKEVAELKKQAHRPVFDGERERELFAKIEAAAKQLGLSVRAARAVFEEVVHQSRREQEVVMRG